MDVVLDSAVKYTMQGRSNYISWKLPEIVSLAQSILSSADSLQIWITAVKKTFQMSSYTASVVYGHIAQWILTACNHTSTLFIEPNVYPMLNCLIQSLERITGCQTEEPYIIVYLHVRVCKRIRIINMTMISPHDITYFENSKVADSIILSQTISHSDHKYSLWCIKQLIGKLS